MPTMLQSCLNHANGFNGGQLVAPFVPGVKWMICFVMFFLLISTIVD